MAKLTRETGVIVTETGGFAADETVTFTDLKFKSRTIVLPDGRAFAVEKNRIVAGDPELIAHLDRRADFARADDGDIG